VVLAAKLAYECPVRATTEARLVGLCDLPAPNFWPGPGTPLNRGATDPRRSGTAEPTRRLLITTSCGLLKQPYTQKPSNVRDLYPKVSRLQPAFRPRVTRPSPKEPIEPISFGFFTEDLSRESKCCNGTTPLPPVAIPRLYRASPMRSPPGSDGMRQKVDRPSGRLFHRRRTQ
jgi:hypothetical protein